MVVVSESGFWVEELLEPLEQLEAAGFGAEFATPSGKLPFPDGASLDATYQDPPLGKPVTSPEMAERGKAQDWSTLFAGRLSLAEWLPVRPYLSDPEYLRKREAYFSGRQTAWQRIDRYAGLLLVGGSGPILDMINNPRVHDLILGFYYADKPIAAECYAVTCLAFARELKEPQKSLLSGKHVTGHSLEYDYTSGWSLFVNGGWVSFGAPPVNLEAILRDTVGPHGAFHSNEPLSVVVDYPFITSRSVAESALCGARLVRALRGDRSPFGWK